MSTAQKAKLDSKADGTYDGRGKSQLWYISGDRRQKNSNLIDHFRVRSSIQGSSINSDLWYLGEPDSGFALKGYAAFANDKKDHLPINAICR